MKTTDHQDYRLDHYEGIGSEQLHFSDRGIHRVSPFLLRGGTTVEEVARVLIDRLVYEEKHEVVEGLKLALAELKYQHQTQAEPNTNPPLVTNANMDGRDVGE